MARSQDGHAPHLSGSRLTRIGTLDSVHASIKDGRCDAHSDLNITVCFIVQQYVRRLQRTGLHRYSCLPRWRRCGSHSQQAEGVRSLVWSTVLFRSAEQPETGGIPSQETCPRSLFKSSGYWIATTVSESSCSPPTPRRLHIAPGYVC